MFSSRLSFLLAALAALAALHIGCEDDESGDGPTVADGGAGGVGGQGGATTGTTSVVDADKLGAPCTSATDCGGLPCFSPDPGADPSGFAGGMCTLPCEDADPCEALVDGARCINGYCIEPCEYGPPDAQALDPSKCHGRADVACFELLESSVVRRLCLPTCNDDAQCGDGMFCEPGEGFCRPVPSQGSPDGWPCSSDGECLGACFGDTPTQRGVCARMCTLGHLPSCGWDGSTTASYGCLLAQDPSSAGIGDGGFCAELCDCNGDCADLNALCIEFADLPHLSNPWAASVVSGSGRVGQCVDAEDAPGGGSGIPCGQGGAGGAGGFGGAGGAGGGGGSS